MYFDYCPRQIKESRLKNEVTVYNLKNEVTVYEITVCVYNEITICQ